MSWKRALEIIDARIGLTSDVESRSLRYWRSIIAKAHVDLQVASLGYGPSLLVSMAKRVDGRTGDSSYPNMMVHEELERFLFQDDNAPGQDS